MEINATDNEYNDNDENADPMQWQQKHGPLQALQQQQAQRRSEAGNKRVFGLLNDRSLPNASATASAAGTGACVHGHDKNTCDMPSCPCPTHEKVHND